MLWLEDRPWKSRDRCFRQEKLTEDTCDRPIPITTFSGVSRLTWAYRGQGEKHKTAKRCSKSCHNKQFQNLLLGLKANDLQWLRFAGRPDGRISTARKGTACGCSGEVQGMPHRLLLRHHLQYHHHLQQLYKDGQARPSRPGDKTSGILDNT